MSSDKNLIINLSVMDLLEIYHQAPKVLSRCATKVSVKKESLHKLNQEPIILVKVKNGNYWVIPTQNVNIYWLLPKNNLKVNDFDQSLQCLFELQGYQKDTNNYFIVKQPAKVSYSGKEWKLEKKGILNFTQTNTSDDVDSGDDELNEFEQLQLELSELRSGFQEIINLLNLLRKDVRENQQTTQREINDVKKENNNHQSVENEPNFTVATPKPPMDTSKLTKDSLVETYNNEPEKLFPHVIEIVESEETIRGRRAVSNVLPLLIKPKKVKGICWIIEVQGTLYLVPKVNLKIHVFILSTIEALFDCQNYQTGNSNNFTLEKPAEVLSSGEDSWTLKQQGILKFEKLSS